MSGKRGPKKAADRVELLLEMLPWLASRRSVKVADMAREFGIAEDELVVEIELASTCGLHPYTPDVLAGFWVDGDTIHVDGAMQFDRRTTLTLNEAFGLALLGAAGRRLVPFKRRSALRSALRKLSKVLGEVDIAVDLGEPRYLEDVNAAVSTRERLAISYWNPDRNDVTERTIVVLSVFSQRGHWYVQADDSLRSARRTFRVDRIHSLEHTGEFAEESPTGSPTAEFFLDDAEGERVVLRLAPGAGWILETYPYVSATESGDGSTEVTLIARGEHWLGRLLLRAGDAATVVSPAKWQNLGAATATSVLSRYQSAG